MYRIRKQFKFEGAHILSSAYSAGCHQNIHGHSYIVELFLKSEELNVDGMVLDFGLLEGFRGIVNEWDHALLVPVEKNALGLVAICQKLIVVGWNPTAENMARVLFDEAVRLYGNDIVEKVRVHETATGWAEYSE